MLTEDAVDGRWPGVASVEVLAAVVVAGEEGTDDGVVAVVALVGVPCARDVLVGVALGVVPAALGIIDVRVADDGVSVTAADAPAPVAEVDLLLLARPPDDTLRCDVPAAESCSMTWFHVSCGVVLSGAAATCMAHSSAVCPLRSTANGSAPAK
jgi:hypothetical protein